MGHLINPISFRVGFFGYWLDNWSPWQYYAYAEMLHHNLILRDLLKESLDGEYWRKTAFFYSHFTIQHLEQSRFIIRVYFYDGMTEQIVQCFATYWVRWVARHNRAYKKRLKRFSSVKKARFKEDLLFWWRYIDYVFAKKVTWFLFVILKRSFERRNKVTRSYFKFNRRGLKKKLQFFKRYRQKYTIDEYLNVLKKLKWKLKLFNNFKRMFSIYYRMNFKRLWYTFLLKNANFEVFNFLRVFFMLLFKFIRFFYYKRRFIRSESWTPYRIFLKSKKKNDNSLLRKIQLWRKEFLIMHPRTFNTKEAFLANKFISKKKRFERFKLMTFLKQFKWVWRYINIYKNPKLLKFKRFFKLASSKGNGGFFYYPEFIYNLPNHFVYNKKDFNFGLRAKLKTNSNLYKKLTYKLKLKKFFNHIKSKNVKLKTKLMLNSFYKRYIKFYLVKRSRKVKMHALYHYDFVKNAARKSYDYMREVYVQGYSLMVERWQRFVFTKKAKIYRRRHGEIAFRNDALGKKWFKYKKNLFNYKLKLNLNKKYKHKTSNFSKAKRKNLFKTGYKTNIRNFKRNQQIKNVNVNRKFNDKGRRFYNKNYISILKKQSIKKSNSNYNYDSKNYVKGKTFVDETLQKIFENNIPWKFSKYKYLGVALNYMKHIDVNVNFLKNYLYVNKKIIPNLCLNFKKRYNIVNKKHLNSFYVYKIKSNKKKKVKKTYKLITIFRKYLKFLTKFFKKKKLIKYNKLIPFFLFCRIFLKRKCKAHKIFNRYNCTFFLFKKIKMRNFTLMNSNKKVNEIYYQWHNFFFKKKISKYFNASQKKKIFAFFYNLMRINFELYLVGKKNYALEKKIHWRSRAYYKYKRKYFLNKFRWKEKLLKSTLDFNENLLFSKTRKSRFSLKKKIQNLKSELLFNYAKAENDTKNIKNFNYNLVYDRLNFFFFKKFKNFFSQRSDAILNMKNISDKFFNLYGLHFSFFNNFRSLVDKNLFDKLLKKQLNYFIKLKKQLYFLKDNLANNYKQKFLFWKQNKDLHLKRYKLYFYKKKALLNLIISKQIFQKTLNSQMSNNSFVRTLVEKKSFKWITSRRLKFLTTKPIYSTLISLDNYERSVIKRTGEDPNHGSVAVFPYITYDWNWVNFWYKGLALPSYSSTTFGTASDNSTLLRMSFYAKRFLFLRSYWLYGLFSYYFVQRRSQFLYLLAREKKVLKCIDPFYAYFSYFRITDIVCKRIVLGFVRSVMIMKRYTYGFMIFEKSFIHMYKHHVLYPFIIRFYGFDNDLVSAVFVARYIAAKLEYKFSVWELFKPIGVELRVVARAERLLSGYKLQFIGRLKRRDRLRYIYNMGGSLPLSKEDAFIEHGYFTGILKNGKCSVRVWIYRHKSFSDFFFNYIYVLY